MGASVIEKHFILDRSIGGPDASFSLNEEEFTLMVKTVREAEKSIGASKLFSHRKTKRRKGFFPFSLCGKGYTGWRR